MFAVAARGVVDGSQKLFICLRSQRCMQTFCTATTAQCFATARSEDRGFGALPEFCHRVLFLDRCWQDLHHGGLIRRLVVAVLRVPVSAVVSTNFLHDLVGGEGRGGVVKVAHIVLLLRRGSHTLVSMHPVAFAGA